MLIQTLNILAIFGTLFISSCKEQQTVQTPRKRILVKTNSETQYCPSLADAFQLYDDRLNTPISDLSLSVKPETAVSSLEGFQTLNVFYDSEAETIAWKACQQADCKEGSWQEETNTGILEIFWCEQDPKLTQQIAVKACLDVRELTEERKNSTACKNKLDSMDCRCQETFQTVPMPSGDFIAAAKNARAQNYCKNKSELIEITKQLQSELLANPASDKNSQLSLVSRNLLSYNPLASLFENGFSEMSDIIFNPEFKQGSSVSLTDTECIQSPADKKLLTNNPPSNSPGSDTNPTLSTNTIPTTNTNPSSKTSTNIQTSVESSSSSGKGKILIGFGVPILVAGTVGLIHSTIVKFNFRKAAKAAYLKKEVKRYLKEYPNVAETAREFFTNSVQRIQETPEYARLKTQTDEAITKLMKDRRAIEAFNLLKEAVVFKTGIKGLTAEQVEGLIDIKTKPAWFRARNDSWNSTGYSGAKSKYGTVASLVAMTVGSILLGTGMNQLDLTEDPTLIIIQKYAVLIQAKVSIL